MSRMLAALAFVAALVPSLGFAKATPKVARFAGTFADRNSSVKLRYLGKGKLSFELETFNPSNRHVGGVQGVISVRNGAARWKHDEQNGEHFDFKLGHRNVQITQQGAMTGYLGQNVFADGNYRRTGR